MTLYRVPVSHVSGLDGERETTIEMIKASSITDVAIQIALRHDQFIVGPVEEVSHVPPPDSGDTPVEDFHRHHRTAIIAIICGGLSGIILGLAFAMR